jgi:hypothetical protein
VSEYGYALFVIIQLDGEVLPVLLVNSHTINRIAITIKKLEIVLVRITLADNRACLELDLVGRVIARFVPDIQILVRQIQGARGILLDAPVQRLDALTTLAVRCVFEELQPGAAEAVLFLENGLVGQRYFDGGVLVAVEAGGVVWEFEDLAPFEVIAFYVVRVEDGVCRVGVEKGGGGIDGDAAVEDDGALWFGTHLLVRNGQSGRRRSDKREEGLCVHCDV